MNPTNPYKSLWTRPRDTIKPIAESGSKRHLFLIPATAGAIQAASSVLGNAANLEAFGVPVLAALVGAVVIGGLFGFVGLWIGSLLVYWTGKLLSGRGTRLTVRAAVTWGYVPMLAATVFNTVIGGLVGLAVGQAVAGAEPSLGAVVPLMIVAGLFMIVTIVAQVWTAIVTSKMVAEVQGYASAWKGFLNLVLPGLVIAVPIILILTSVVLVSFNSAREEAEKAAAEAIEVERQVQQGVQLELR